MAAPELDKMLCFALYSASRAMTAAYRPLLDDLGLTYPQYLVMIALREARDDGRDDVTVSQLGSTLHLDSGTLSPLIKRLQVRGLVVRRRSPLDERSVLIGLTRDGVALSEQAACVPTLLMQQLDVEGLDIDAVRDGISAVAEALASADARAAPTALALASPLPMKEGNS